MSDKENIDKLRTRDSHLDQWLSQHREADKAVPYAQQLRDYTKWQIDVLSNQPDEARDIPAPELPDIDRENQLIQSAFPLAPKVNYSMVNSASGISAIANTAVHTFVMRVGQIPTENAQSYSKLYTQKYQELENKYPRVVEIKGMLARLPDSLALKRIDLAFESFTKSKSQVIPRTAAANDIRNLLYGFQADLYNLAYGKTRDNKTWEGMSAKVAKGGATSFEFAQLLNQKSMYSSLCDRLSDIGKDREGGFYTDLDLLWTQTLDHIYSVLNLISIA